MLWQQFLEQRSNVVGNKMQREVRRMAWRPPLALASRTFPSTIVMDASHISRPTFPLQVQKIVMDFLKENKDGGKVSAVHEHAACVHWLAAPSSHRARPLHSHTRLHRW